ncbi:MAG: hypothetical protein JWN34_2272 [Bryobacterales bacterium]|nr:hypothetical protein [Bryobacterales bacterium]
MAGPDAGVRFNYRVGRFIKSYLPASIRWNDSYYYLQAQGYWVLANWRLFCLTNDPLYSDIAVGASNCMMERQRADGAWDYPNPEWKGRVATAEGTWAALGLLETFRRSSDRRCLDSAVNWYQFLIRHIGFRQSGDELSVNYFSNVNTPRVPNNSAFVLRFLGEVAELTGADSYLEPARGLITFIGRAQKPTGEIPYMAKGDDCGVKCRDHFQCYQYNAFQCMDLMRHYELSGDSAACRIAAGCLDFLRGGSSREGYVYYDCHHQNRTVTYHSAAFGAAFETARRLAISGPEQCADRAFSYLLRRQRPDGAFPSSRGDYRLLSDTRAYPRPLTMILYHLLVSVETLPNAELERTTS